MPDHKRQLGACQAALQALSPLPRAVFLLHCVDGLSYAAISQRLSMDVKVVERCIAYALATITLAREGRAPRPCPYPEIARAEAALLAKYRGQAPAARPWAITRWLQAWGKGHAPCFSDWLMGRARKAEGWPEKAGPSPPERAGRAPERACTCLSAPRYPESPSAEKGCRCRRAAG